MKWARLLTKTMVDNCWLEMLYMGHEISYECWELNLGPLRKQQALLTTDSSPLPSPSAFISSSAGAFSDITFHFS